MTRHYKTWYCMSMSYLRLPLQHNSLISLGKVRLADSAICIDKAFLLMTTS